MRLANNLDEVFSTDDAITEDGRAPLRDCLVAHARIGFADVQIRKQDGQVLRALAASRGAAAPSRHRRDSRPGEEVVGGFFFDFEAVRTVRRLARTANASLKHR